jgi:hypothetical protein
MQHYQTGVQRNGTRMGVKQYQAYELSSSTRLRRLQNEGRKTSVFEFHMSWHAMCVDDTRKQCRSLPR